MKPTRDFYLYNVIFPTFLFFYFPPLLGIAAGANLILDAVVLFSALWFFHVKIRRRLVLLMQLWACGLLADIVGSLFLILVGMSEQWLGNNVSLLDEYFIYSTPQSIVFFGISVILSGVLIYRFDLKVLKRRLTLNQSRRIALAFAVITAPYTFLIPTNWLV